jgi:hypothetical protein
MRFTKKQLSLWRVVLIIGVAAVGMAVAARVSPTATIVNERQDYRHQQTAAVNKDADAKDSADSKAVVGKSVALRQDYYDRRRQYWEKRVDRRLERREEYLDRQTANENKADSKNGKKDSKAVAEDEEEDIAADDEDAPDDTAEREVDRRREYWRKRVEKEW